MSSWCLFTIVSVVQETHNYHNYRCTIKMSDHIMPTYLARSTGQCVQVETNANLWICNTIWTSISDVLTITQTFWLFKYNVKYPLMVMVHGRLTHLTLFVNKYYHVEFMVYWYMQLGCPMHNINDSDPQQCHVGLTVFHGMFSYISHIQLECENIREHSIK